MDSGGTAGGGPSHSRGREPVGVPRRAVLTGVVASLGLLAGCGVRLDLPQPPPPVPTREKVADEDLLVGFVRDVRVLVAQAQALPAAEAAHAGVRDAVRVLREQDVVLTGRLTNAGVPTAVINTAPVSGPTASTTAAPDAATGPGRLGAVLAELPTGRWESLAGSHTDTRLILLSATSARLAAAVRLGAAVAPRGQSPQAVHAALLERTAPLVYGFEVVAAQSTGAARTAALTTLDALHALLDDVGPGLPGRALPGGWQLPYAVTTPQAAARLARDLLRRAIGATPQLVALARSATGLENVAAWSARVQALGPAHGIPLTAFPGTSGGPRS